MSEHNEFCDGHVTCPTTGKEECSKVMNYLVLNDGSQIPATVFCFGCNKTHDVEAFMEVGSRNSEESAEDEA